MNLANILDLVINSIDFGSDFETFKDEIIVTAENVLVGESYNSYNLNESQIEMAWNVYSKGRISTADWESLVNVEL